MEGLRPILYTITPFLIERAFEQIKIDVDQMNLPVGLVGYSDNSAGPTHKERDARALMAMFPNISSYWPPDKAALTARIATMNLDKPWFVGIEG